MDIVREKTGSLEEKIAEISADIDKSDDSSDSVLSGVIYQKLVASECLLIQAYDHSVQCAGSGIQCSSVGGYTELGPVLYWLNNPSAKWKSKVDIIKSILKFIEGESLPPSQITPCLYAKIVEQAKGDGVIADDGTIYGEGKYEQLDQGWLTSLFYFLYYEYYSAKKHPFGDAPKYKPIPLTANCNQQVSIAIIGDWGTGEFNPDGGMNANKGPAVAVMNAAESLNPDYIIHLGDVYYAGTQGYDGFLSEETTNFLNLWPADRKQDGAKANTSFTLNSNHEMYDGANGYFSVALGAKNTPFNMQKGHSYFALTFDNWVILGLDSGYFASVSSMFMNGSIGGDSGTQANWVKEQFPDFAGKNVIVMTHHTGIANTNDPNKPFKLEDPLWSEITSVVNGTPDYWYWGHLHNGIVYKDNVPGTGSSKMRCVGHGAIPYAEAWGLQPATWSNHLDYFAQTPEPGGKPRARNGFAMITLGKDHAITETFYEVDDGSSTPIPMWPKQ